MTLVATSWEVEVELVHADYVASKCKRCRGTGWLSHQDERHSVDLYCPTCNSDGADEARFRAAMARLGFDEGEIESHLEALRT